VQVVKALWAYIKENNLQDPSDKRNILPDAKLGKVLQAPVNQFSLQKQLSKHILKSS
jgi:chromatin remodeling complex protein RSC6